MSDASSLRYARHALLREERITAFKNFLDKEFLAKNQPLPLGHSGKPNMRLLTLLSGLSINSDYYIELAEMAQEYAKTLGFQPSANLRKALYQPSTRRKSSQEEITYSELMEHNFPNISERSQSHYKSALSRFVKVIGKSTEDKISEEFSSDFSEKIQIFIKESYRGNKQKARSSVAAIRKWQSLWSGIMRKKGLNDSFHIALRELIDQKGYSVSQLSRAINRTDAYIQRLMQGQFKYPLPKDIKALEDILEVQRGTLLGRLPKYDIRRNPEFCPNTLFPPELQGDSNSVRWRRGRIKKLLPDNFPEIPQAEKEKILTRAIKNFSSNEYLSDYEKTIAENYSFAYSIKDNEITESLEQELSSLMKMKKERGGADRYYPKTIWKEETAQKWKGDILLFLGFCNLNDVNPQSTTHKGLNIPLKELTLGLIVIKEVVEAYIDFKYERMRGKHTTSSDIFISYCLAMLKEKKGWVSAHPELLKKLPNKYQEQIQNLGGWENACNEQYKFLLELRKFTNFETSRNAFLPIWPIIDNEKPLEYILLALKNARREIEEKKFLIDTSPLEYALLWRDYILFSLISRVPFRSKNWRQLNYIQKYKNTHRTPERANLRRLEDGRWVIYIEAKEFKNHRSRTLFGEKFDRDVILVLEDVPALSGLSAELTFYMENIRPLLCDEDGPVFPNIYGSYMDTYAFNRVGRNWTQKMLSEHGDIEYGLGIKGVKGFGPHSFRHIVASHVVKTTGSFEAAADLLLDSVETVRKHYGFLAPRDRIKNALAQVHIWDTVTTKVEGNA